VRGEERESAKDYLKINKKEKNTKKTKVIKSVFVDEEKFY